MLFGNFTLHPSKKYTLCFFFLKVFIYSHAAAYSFLLGISIHLKKFVFVTLDSLLIAVVCLSEYQFSFRLQLPIAGRVWICTYLQLLIGLLGITTLQLETIHSNLNHGRNLLK